MTQKVAFYDVYFCSHSRWNLLYFVEAEIFTITLDRYKKTKRIRNYKYFAKKYKYVRPLIVVPKVVYVGQFFSKS
jgi:hypothetical protein